MQERIEEHRYKQMDTKPTDTKPNMLKEIGTIVSLISLTVGIFINVDKFISGRQTTVSPQLRSVIQQQLTVKSQTESISLNACTVRNEGDANADDVVVQIGSKENLVFSELNVEGGERNCTTKGGVGESYAEISCPRLLATRALTVTVRTEAPITFLCEAADKTGPVKRPVQNTFNLQGWDFGVLLSGEFVFNVFGIILAYFLIGKALERRLLDSSKR